MEEYDFLQANLESKLAMYQRYTFMMHAENRKLRANMKKFKVSIIVLMVAMIIMYVYVKVPVGGTMKMLASS